MYNVNIIFELMKERKIQQKDLAAEIGISQSVLSDWKSGRLKPSIDIILKIANYLDVSVDYLLGNDSAAVNNAQLTDKQKAVLAIAEQLPDEDVKKLIDYAELLAKASEKE